MANYEVRLFMTEIDKSTQQEVPEVTVELWDNDELNERTNKKGVIKFASYASAPEKGKPYDTISSKSDANSDGDIDAKDDAILLELVNTFMKIK